jgi:hypothetical protein
VNLDDDALMAAADLVGRTGARGFEIGYTHDDVPPEDAGWYANAQYQGARIMAEGAGPVEAAEALARTLLTGAKCIGCGGLVALSDGGAVAFGGLMTDGSTWTAEEAAAAGQCRWTRMGRKWVSACGAGADPPRKQRRGKRPRRRR